MSRLTLVLLAVVIGAAVLGVDAGKRRVQTKCKEYAARFPIKVLKTPRGVSRVAANPGPGAILKNADVKIGVSEKGTLGANDPAEAAGSTTEEVGYVGLSYLDDKFVVPELGSTPVYGDATADGCICEGWGASAIFDDNTSAEGGFKVQDTIDPVVADSIFETTFDSSIANQAKSSGAILTDQDHKIKVDHHFQPFAGSTKLWQINVTITNVGSKKINQLQYLRTMDWDIVPTPFEECVDLQLGTAAAANGDLYCVSNNGLGQVLPSLFQQNQSPEVIYRGKCNGNTQSVLGSDGTHDDQGAAFLFRFHDITEQDPLFVNGKKEFTIFYGAADNEAEASELLKAAKIEAWSFGFPNSRITDPAAAPDCSYRGYRYIFGFGGIGGVPFTPTCEGQNCPGKQALSTCTSAHVETATANCVTLSFEGQESCH